MAKNKLSKKKDIKTKAHKRTSAKFSTYCSRINPFPKFD